MSKYVIVGLVATAMARDAHAAALDFERDIRPILATHCLKCHGRDEPEAELNLVTLEGATAPAASGRVALVPGKPEESELLRRITAADPAERMPPAEEKALSPDQIAKLTEWVAAGAPWREHWSFAPLAASELPAVANVDWVRGAIDRFVLARLEAQAIAPSPEAPREVLIKRLSYDLLGLPPAPEEVDAFVADTSPDAYEKLVDRLLASPHFGERWGRHWLDLAHYADSDGYEKDRARPDAFHYRDWVIDAINRDVPFDQFTILQLAGDLMPEATADDRVATAFLRQTLTNEEGGVDQEEFRVNACFDRTDTVGTVWLGLTVGCAKCHSHKYDPLPQNDYYRLFAFFNEADENWTDLPREADDRAALLTELVPLEAELAARYRELAPAEAAWESSERERLLAIGETPRTEHGLNVVGVELLDQADGAPQVEGDDVFLPPSSGAVSPEKQTHTLTLELRQTVRLTGIKLVALTDERLPRKGPGRTDHGNFVLTGFELSTIDSAGQKKTLALHRAEADYAQPGFPAENVLKPNSEKPTGWAVGGKVGEEHWIALRTHEPVELAAGTRLQVMLRQDFGGRHTLGKFRIVALAGDEQGLDLSDARTISALRMYPEKRVADTRQQLFDYYIEHVACDARCAELRHAIDDVRRRHHAKLTRVRTIGRARLARSTRVFHRGEFLSPGESVVAGTPSLLPSSSRTRQPDRLDLAHWLISAENPLTPRVVVNQIWQHLFGRAMVTTANDFGVRGDPPSHPELLDWLAVQFRGPLGWSRKQLVRLIVTSTSYRQSSAHRPELAERDPGNQWIARQGRFRVEAEIVRDLSLAASGLLVAKIGGPSVFPPMPDELAKLSYANTFSWTNSEGEDRYRRGMYTFLKRTILHPSLTTFDAPDTNGACTARTVSNTPLQALLLLNNDAHLEACRALAVRMRAANPAALAGLRLLADGASDRPLPSTADGSLPATAVASRVAYGFRLCVARPPRTSELDALLQLLSRAQAWYVAQPQEAAKLLNLSSEATGAAPNEAAWVVVARVLLNLDEFLTRE